MNKAKYILGLILVSLILTSCYEESNSVVNDITYSVSYFHPTARCESCINIENFTKELIESKYSSPPVVIKYISLNIEEPENEHFRKDYSLKFSSIILSRQKNGVEVKFKNLDSIWTYSNNKEGFVQYLDSEIQSFVK